MLQFTVTSLVNQLFVPLVPKNVGVIVGGDASAAAPGVDSRPAKARIRAAAQRRMWCSYPDENTNELPPSTLPYLLAEKVPKPGHTYHR